MKLSQIIEAKYAFTKTADEVHQIYRKIASDYKNNPESSNITLGGLLPPQTVNMTRYQHLYPDQTKPYINTNISFLVHEQVDKETAIQTVKEIVDRYNAPYHSIDGFRQHAYWHITVAYRE